MLTELKPNSRFKLQNNIFIEPDRLKTLTLLYQPLIGAEGISLFLTLNAFLVGGVYEHHILLQIFNFDVERLLQSRHRLEAVGLLDTYGQKGGYVYKIKDPLSSTDFFNDGILNAFLYLKVGNVDYAQIKSMIFAQKAPVDGKKMSKKFNDVFDTSCLARSNALKEISGVAEQKKSRPELKSSINPEFLASLLRQKGFDEAIISLKLLQLLDEMAFLYKLDAHELARVVFNATDPSGAVDFDKIKHDARSHFRLLLDDNQIDNHPKVVIASDKEMPLKSESVKSESVESEDGVTRFLSQNPVDFLQFKAGGASPVPADIKLVEWLYIDQKMHPGVVNVLVDYVLDYTDGNLPKPLVEKIAGQWQRKGIFTIQEAIKQVKSVVEGAHERKKGQQAPIQTKPTLRKATRIEPTPEWFGKVHEQEGTGEPDTQTNQRIKEMKEKILSRSR